MNLTESLLLALKARGATEIFGIPGDFALPLFEQFERLALLPLHTLSHEPAVGFAADAAARSRGEYSKREFPKYGGRWACALSWAAYLPMWSQRKTTRSPGRSV